MPQVTGYYKGKAYQIEVVPFLGVMLSPGAAWDLYYLVLEAHKAGLKVRANSGWRDNDKQAELHRTLPKGQAAPPGYSNHQMGWAVDLDVKGEPGLLEWLRANGRRFHWYETVKSEPWHWEWRPG